MQIDILTEKEAATLKELIAASSHILVTAHKSPDGDALGACLGWTEYLRSVGKEPHVVVPDAFPDFLRWLPEADKIVRFDKHADVAKALFDEADLVFCLDFNEPGRVEEMEPLLSGCKADRVLIDHHLNPNIEARLTVSHPEMSSTCELVFRLVWQLGAFESMSRQWAVCVYCGMMTDTGGFTYNSSRPEIYFIICQLLTKGIDKDKIYRKVYDNYSAWAIRFRGYLMLQKMNHLADAHACFYSVSRSEMSRFRFTKGDLEGLVNVPLRIKGVRLSIALREDTERDNLVLVSLRSVGTFPCNRMAADFFNGGGHLNASGGKLNCTLAEAEQVARQAIAAYAQMLGA